MSIQMYNTGDRAICIPKETFKKIISYLDAKYIISILTVCTSWHAVLRCNAIWQKWCPEVTNHAHDCYQSYRAYDLKGGFFADAIKTTKHKFKLLINLIYMPARGLCVTQKEIISEFFGGQVYIWKRAECLKKSDSTEGGDYSDPSDNFSLLDRPNMKHLTVVDNKHFCTSLSGERIYILDSQGNEVKTLAGHKKITCFEVNSEMIVSGFEDGTIRVWNHKGEHLKTCVMNDGDTASCLKSKDGSVFVGTTRGCIGRWQLKSSEGPKKKAAYKESVRCLRVNDEFLVAGGRGRELDDGDVIDIWVRSDDNVYTRVHTLPIKFLCFEIIGDLLAIAQEGRILFYGLYTGESLWQLTINKIVSMQFRNNIFVTNSKDGVQVWGCSNDEQKTDSISPYGQVVSYTGKGLVC